MIYETPSDVADWMANFVPVDASRILEPAAGNGALLKALANRLTPLSGKIVAVDRKRGAIKKCSRVVIPSSWSLKTYAADFLSLKLNGNFNCVIMNPPFASRREKWISIKFEGSEFRCSIEAAFVLKTVGLLTMGGRMIALLPAGIISGQSNQWIRTLLEQKGTIEMVHELPARTFPTADVKTYIMVFDKLKKQQPLRLLNHSLVNPEQLFVKCDQKRLDFSYHEAERNLKRLRVKSAGANPV